MTMTAVISAATTLIVCLVNNYYQSKNVAKKHEEQTELILYRIEQLEKKQDKHNGLIERTYKLEQDVAVLTEKQEVSNHRIKDLEHSA